MFVPINRYLEDGERTLQANKENESKRLYYIELVEK